MGWWFYLIRWPQQLDCYLPAYETEHFTVLEPQNTSIEEFYAVPIGICKVPKVVNCSVGYLADCTVHRIYCTHLRQQ